MSEKGSIHAGRRVFDNDCERPPYCQTRGGTKLGDETMRILDYMETAFNG